MKEIQCAVCFRVQESGEQFLVWRMSGGKSGLARLCPRCYGERAPFRSGR